MHGNKFMNSFEVNGNFRIQGHGMLL